MGWVETHEQTESIAETPHGTPQGRRAVRTVRLAPWR
jgi:hypothetical protein